MATDRPEVRKIIPASEVKKKWEVPHARDISRINDFLTKEWSAHERQSGKTIASHVFDNPALIVEKLKEAGYDAARHYDQRDGDFILVRIP